MHVAFYLREVWKVNYYLLTTPIALFQVKIPPPALLQLTFGTVCLKCVFILCSALVWLRIKVTGTWANYGKITSRGLLWWEKSFPVYMLLIVYLLEERQYLTLRELSAINWMVKGLIKRGWELVRVATIRVQWLKLSLAFDRQLSSTHIDFELVQILMRVDESLCAFDLSVVVNSHQLSPRSTERELRELDRELRELSCKLSSTLILVWPLLNSIVPRFYDE